MTLLDQVSAAAPAGAPPAGGKRGGPSLPPGVRLQNWYIDKRSRVVKTTQPVPVDAENRLYPLGDFRCPSAKCSTQEWLPPASRRHCPTCGARLAVTGKTAGGGDTARKALVTDAVRLHGASALPWVALIATSAAGATAHAAGPGTSVLMLPAAVGGAYLIARFRALRIARARGMERGERQGRHVRYIRRTARRAAVLTGAAGAWSLMASAVDLHTPLGKATYAALAVGWALTAFPTWRAADQRRTDRNHRPAPAALPAGPASAERTPAQMLEDHAVTCWTNDIGGQSGPLAGTVLTDWRLLPPCEVGGPDRERQPNWTARVVSKPGGSSVNMRKLRPDLPGAIAAAYGVSQADVSFAADPHNNATATVRVCPDNYLAAVRAWAGPSCADWSRGITTIGRFEDDEPVTFQFYDEGGARHAMVSGCSGSGKSELVLQLLLTALHSGGRVLAWVGDPQRGQSFGMIRDHVDWFASSIVEIKLMLLAAKVEMLRRNDVLAAAYQKTWQPTPDMPLLVIVLDEVQSYAEDQEIQRLLEDLAGMARKVGIAIWAITQVPAAYAFGGNSIYVKEQLTMQRLIFRASTGQAAGHATEDDVPFNPTMLPKSWGPSTAGAGRTTAGLLYVMGTYGRDVFGRTDFTGDGNDMRQWLIDEDGNTITTPGVFTAAAAEASGSLWGGRHKRAATAATAGLDPRDLLPGGKALELLVMAEVLQTAATYEPESSSALVVAGRNPARDRVLRAAREVADDDGIVTKQQISDATEDVPRNTRDKAIADLRADGALQPIEGRRGTYRVIPADAE